MKRIGITLIAGLLASGAVFAQAPAGWKVIRDDKGKCQMAVPADWQQSEILGKKIAAAAAGDNTVDSVVSLMEGVDWAMFKSVVFSIYAKEKDRPKIEDGAKRMWFEIVTMKPEGKTGWYVAVPGAAGTCNAQVNFKAGDKKAEETARKIVDSIRSG